LAISPLLEFDNLTAVTLAASATAEVLTDSEVAVEAVILYADDSNAGTIYVGGSAVDAASGIPLKPKENWPIWTDRSHGATADIDLRSIYVTGTMGDKVRVAYLKRDAG